MTGPSVLLLSTAILASAVVVLVLITAVGRAVRLRRARTCERLRDELRPTLVAVLSDPDAPRRETPRRGRRQELFDVLALDYLTKVKGESRDALVGLLLARGTIDSAERRLRRPGVVGQAAAAELLGRCGLARSRDPLLELLQRRSADVRAVAVRALGRLGEADVIDALLGTVGAPRSVPAAIVAQSALRIGPSAIAPLHAAATRPDDAVRAVAAAVLGLIRAIEAVPTLIDLLANDDSIAVRRRAARALGHIGDPRAVEPLIHAALHDDEIAGFTASALGELGDARGIAALSTLVADRRHDVATAAATALTHCGSAGYAALRDVEAGGGPAAAHAVAAVARAALAGRSARTGSSRHDAP